MKKSRQGCYDGQYEQVTQCLEGEQIVYGCKLGEYATRLNAREVIGNQAKKGCNCKHSNWDSHNWRCDVDEPVGCNWNKTKRN